MEADGKIGNREIWVNDMWMEKEELSCCVNVFIVHVNAHQRTCTKEETLNEWTQVLSQPPSSEPQCWHDEHVNRVATVAAMEATYGFPGLSSDLPRLICL